MNGKTLQTLRDPRILQIVLLGSLLSAGAWLRDFSLEGTQVVLTFAVATLTQIVGSRLAGRRSAGLPSALVTSLGLSLLLRADNLWVHPLCAFVAIAAKFVVQVRGKHLFNPANLGVILGVGVLPGAWVSAGQWGHDVALAGWLVAGGALVVSRARIADISWAFLAVWLGAIALRVAWLGQEWAVWWHQLSDGALLLFSFFMISDPRTSPSHPLARLLHAVVVAAVAYVWRFELYAHNGLLWSLFLCAGLVPLWDVLFPAPVYEWNGGSHERSTTLALSRDRARGSGPLPQPTA